MHAQLEMDGQQLPGEISAIVNLHVPGRLGGQKVERSFSFIAMGEKVERDRDFLWELNQATEQEPFLIVGWSCLLTGTLQNAPVERPHVGGIGAISVDTGLARVHRNELARL